MSDELLPWVQLDKEFIRYRVDVLRRHLGVRRGKAFELMIDLLDDATTFYRGGWYPTAVDLARAATGFHDPEALAKAMLSSHIIEPGENGLGFNVVGVKERYERALKKRQAKRDAKRSERAAQRAASGANGPGFGPDSGTRKKSKPPESQLSSPPVASDIDQSCRTRELYINCIATAAGERAEVRAPEPSQPAAADGVGELWGKLLAHVDGMGLEYVQKLDVEFLRARTALAGLRNDEATVTLYGSDWQRDVVWPRCEALLETAAEDLGLSLRFVVDHRGEHTPQEAIARTAALERERLASETRSGIRDCDTFVRAACYLAALHGRSPPGKLTPTTRGKLQKLLDEKLGLGSAAVFDGLGAFYVSELFRDRRWGLQVFLSGGEGDWRVAGFRIDDAAKALAECA